MWTSRYFSLTWPCLVPALTFVLTSWSCGLVGEFPRFPCQACTQPLISCVFVGAASQPDITCPHSSTHQHCSLAWVVHTHSGSHQWLSHLSTTLPTPRPYCHVNQLMLQPGPTLFIYIFFVCLFAYFVCFALKFLVQVKEPRSKVWRQTDLDSVACSLWDLERF